MTQAFVCDDRWDDGELDSLLQMSVDHSETWLTKRELADVLRCSIRTIDRLHLPALRVGGRNRYRLSEVEAYLRDGHADQDVVGSTSRRKTETIT